MINKIIKFKKLLSKHHWRLALLKGVAANIELFELVKNLKFKSVIDIGSNKGQFILLTLDLNFPKQIFSFEPQLDELKKQKRLFKKINNIKFYNFALGEKNKISKFYITKRKDSSSLLKINKKIIKNDIYNIIDSYDIKVFTAKNVFKSIKLEKPILVKIDVQGYEFNVLRGFGNLLFKVDYLIIEISNYEIYKNQKQLKNIIKYLSYYNFKIKKQNNWTKIEKNKNFKQRDILFAKQK